MHPQNKNTCNRGYEKPYIDTPDIPFCHGRQCAAIGQGNSLPRQSPQSTSAGRQRTPFGPSRENARSQPSSPPSPRTLACTNCSCNQARTRTPGGILRRGKQDEARCSYTVVQSLQPARLLAEQPCGLRTRLLYRTKLRNADHRLRCGRPPYAIKNP